MDPEKQKRLKAAGWEVGSYADFLGLTIDERLLVELRAAISKAIRRVRELHGSSLADLAERIGSEQSRLAKVESGASDVSLDLMCRVLFASGGTLGDLALAATEAEESDRGFEALKEVAAETKVAVSSGDY